MTASNGRASQASQVPGLQFERAGKYHTASPEGYVVTCTRMPGGWVFSAFTPRKPVVYHRDGRITTGGEEHRSHYAQGERVPTPRALLGCWSSSANGIEAARAAAERACAQHFAAASVDSGASGPSSALAVRSREPAEFG